MNLTELFAHIEELVSNTAALSDLEGKLYVGLADSFPAITVDGIVASADKQDSYTFNINIIYTKANGKFSESAAFYNRVEALKEAIEQSPAIIGGQWLDRPQDGFNRALFFCKSA